MARPHYHQADTLVIGTMFVLIAFGLVMLSSAGGLVGFLRFGHVDYFLKRQFISFLVGIAAFLLCARLDYHVWRKYAMPFLIISVVLLVLVFVPGIGFSAGGARRWISLGSFLLQPAELVKLSFLLYLAVWLERRGKHMKDLSYGFLPFVVLLASIVLLVLLQPDLGTASIIVFLSLMVYYIAGAPLRYLGLFLAVSAILLGLIIKFEPYRAARLAVFLNPNVDPEGIGYHINQALLAIGSGGIFGVGLGQSQQKGGSLPEATGDSIFAVIAEELGFLWVLVLIGLFVFFLWRGIGIARAAPDAFGKYIAVGITAGIVVQALINMAALSGLLPLTGITLPFISSGGSSLIVTMTAVGVLVNISKQTRS